MQRKAVPSRGNETAERTSPVESTDLRFLATRSSGEVSATLMRREDARWLFVLAHGAGAGMRHPFLESIAERLAARGIATLRYQFPYMEQGRRRPDPPPILVATVRSAVAFTGELAGDLPLLAGGKSMGGRMTSTAAAERSTSAVTSAESAFAGVRGLVFLGFPLHAAGKPSAERGDHLTAVRLPMLFLQGARDRLADLDLLRPLCRGLGDRATLHVVEGADHSFHMPRTSGRTDGDILDELARTVAEWADGL